MEKELSFSTESLIYSLIRQRFDLTKSNTEAQQCIQAATELGFKALAEEMQNDFKYELDAKGVHPLFQGILKTNFNI